MENLTINSNGNTPKGSYPFTISVNGVTSAAAALEVSEAVPADKSIAISGQKGEIFAGQNGEAQFQITATNIAVGITPVINWTDKTPTGVTGIITPIEETDKTVLTIASNGDTPKGNYGFTISADGITSVAAVLTVSEAVTTPLG